MSSQEDYSKEPTTTARVEYDEATKQQALERAKLPETIPDDKTLQQRQLEASYSRLRAPSPSAVAEVDKYISYIEEQKTAKKRLAQIESSLPELKTKAEVEAKYETDYQTYQQQQKEEAWYTEQKNKMFSYWISGIKAQKGTEGYQQTYNEMKKMADDYVVKLKQQEANLQERLSNPNLTQKELRSAVWDYRDTYSGSQLYSSLGGSGASERALAEAQDMIRRGATRNINRKYAEAGFYFVEGYDPQAWAELVRAEDRNRANALRQSAGLRAQGNLQIQQAQQAELQRLGGTGQLTSGAGVGATKVSVTLTQGTNLSKGVQVALGVAQKAQDFAPSFLTTSEIQAKNQAYFESKGLGDYYKQQLASPVSNALNSDPRANLVGSLDSGFAQRQTVTSTVPQVQKVQTQTPVSGLTVNQGIVASNLQARAQQKQQVKDIGTQKRTSTVITTGTVQSVLSTTPTTQANFVSGLDPRRYTDKSLMGTNVKATSTDPDTQLKNIQQRQYTAELRAGNIGLATALLNPQTTQTYQVKGKTVPREATSINAESYFQQLGYDTKKSDLIPNSVFKPVKFEEARLQASKAEKTGATMGDLTKLIPTAPQATPETVRQRKEAQIRVIKAGQPVVTAPKEYNSDKTLIGTGVVNLVKKTQTTTVGASEEALTVPTEKKNVFEFDPIAVQVGKTQKYQFGEGETAKEFSTLAEAQSYARGLEPKVYEGNIFNKFLRTGEAIDLGEIDKARTPEQQIGEVVSRATMPIRNITYEVMNLARPEEEKIKIVQTGFGTLVGETIDSAITGKPLDTGVRKTIEYYTEKPIRIVEAPAEIATFVAGGRAIQGVAKGGIVLKEVAKESPKIPQVIKTGIFTGEKVASKVQAVPSKITGGIDSRVQSFVQPKIILNLSTGKLENKLTTTQKFIKTVDEKLNKIGASRVGVSTKLNLTLTRSGRRFMKETEELKSTVPDSTTTILSRNISLIESPQFTILKTRGGVKTTLPEQQMPKSKSFDFEIDESRSLESLRYARLGQPNDPTPAFFYARPYLGKPSLPKVPQMQTGNLERIKYATIKFAKKFKEPRKSQEELITIYSDDVGKEVVTRPTQTEIFGRIDPARFEGAKVIRTTTVQQPFKTSTSKPASYTSKNVLQGLTKTEKEALKTGMLEEQKLSTGIRVQTKKNLETLESLQEKEVIQRVGKKTVFTKEEFREQGLKKLRASENPNLTREYDPIRKKFITKKETDIFTTDITERPISNAFAKTMQKSRLLKAIERRNKSIQDTIGKGETPRPTGFTEEKLGTGVNIQPSGKPPINNLSRKSDLNLVQKPQSQSPLNKIAKAQAEQLSKKAKEESSKRLKSRTTGFVGSAVIGTAYIETTPAVATPFVKPELTTPTKSIEIPSTITNVRETPAVKISSGVIPLIATKTLTSTKQVTQTKLETSQVPKLETKVSTTQVQRPITITTPKLAVKQTAKLSLKQAQAFATPTPTLNQYKRPFGAFVYIPKAEIEEKGKKKVNLGSKKDFIGNVRLDSIYNVYKRRDITYGAKKVAKLEKQDKRVSKRVPNMLTSATSEMKKGGGKKKKKSETLLGFEFTKTKDEFNSFGSSLTGSKKGKKGKKGKKTKIRLI